MRRFGGSAALTVALRSLAVLCVVLLAVLPTGCAGGATRSDASIRPAGAGAVTITVPGDAPTISAAVAAAEPGDLVLVGPGTYRETVQITTDGITLRGTDRARVVIDGEVIRPNGVVVRSAGVTVQNLTVRHALLNGVLVTGLPGDGGGSGYARPDLARFPLLAGFHIDHVTSYNNGLYGIYAFHARDGLIENSYTSGMADSGIYVGQCKPCGIVVRSNVSERNAVGYEGTNASENMVVVGNRFAGNRVGATISSDHQEAFTPQQGSVLAGNVIAANNQRDSPEQADGGFGLGLGIAGGTKNTVARNLVTGNSRAGMVITSAADFAPLGNQIRHNTLIDNGVDIAYTPNRDAPGQGNCYADNRFSTTFPDRLLAGARCPAAQGIGAAAGPATGPAPPGIPFTDVPPPPVQPGLPDVRTIPPRWTADRLDPPGIDTVALPGADLLEHLSAISW
ncbi:MAG TPA: right-handed parallel beta-helix repeat-containing protein [Pseudonocardiaceae bacterium]|nr:right-handed parallel beta-helix repeat-containing protein [Pseudonocardiaceae bacterium]